jgi:hypothetical protein
MAAEEMVGMYPLECDGCGTKMPVYSDQPALAIILCQHCVTHPEELEARLAARS